MRLFNNTYITIIFVGFLVTLLGPGCSKKNIPQGDALYLGASLIIKDSVSSTRERKTIKSDLEHLLRPTPNSKFLGIKFKLGFYNLAGTRNNFASKFLRKIGEPPVLMSYVKISKNVQLLTNFLENKGFFHANVKGDTTVSGNVGKAYYFAVTGNQYKIDSVTFPDDSSNISIAIRSIASATILKRGDPFVLDVIKGERLRIDMHLKEHGYYFFNPEQLIVLVDSTIGGHTVNLFVRYKQDIPYASKQIYSIDKVIIYSNYNLTTAIRDTLKTDSEIVNGFQIIDRKKTFKPELFSRILTVNNGSIYNRTNHNLSLSRLINLGTFQFVKNRFEVDPDSFKLNAYYYLTPMKRKSISAEIGGLSKSSNVTGSELTVNWRNRNTFKGAELLSIAAYIGAEVQFSGQYSGYNTLRYGTEVNLSSPRFLIPFLRLNTSNAFVPRTNFQLGYDILNRQKLFALNSFRGQMGYIWKESIKKEHRFNPIVVNYVQPITVTEEYLKSIQNNPVLKRSIDTQFILGSNYNFNFNELNDGRLNTSGWYFNGLLDLSGNIAGLVSGASVKDGKERKIWGTPFSQFIKSEFDLRRYIQVGLKNQWANRIVLGVGYPYGNSTILPFVKQFFVGGNNSLRGFRSRSVGPGTYNGGILVDSSGFLSDMTGDLKLELNSEFRMKIANIFYGALFIDAGNIWLWNSNSNQPGGKFSKNFLKELAVDAGIGLRIDLVILLLRLDLGIPLRKPWLPDGQRSVINKIDFSSSQWRKENMIYNLAIGLPF